MKPIIAFHLLILATAAHAGPRASANYTISTDTADSGGRRSNSATYTNDSTIGTVAGLSTSPSETAKAGYTAQLYDVAGLLVTSAAPSLNETATLQLAAWNLLDDNTTLSLAASEVAWSVNSGPITGISPAGLATAGTVYQTTQTIVQAAQSGFTGVLTLSVLDTITDNFGTYAADGLADDWQVQYFGINNPLAAPGVDACGNGHTNLFKYTAGLNPLDPADRFRITLAPVPGQPGQKAITFSPRFANRTYTVKATTTLSAPTWTEITTSAPTDNGNERTLFDLNANTPTKFYRVEITKP